MKELILIVGNIGSGKTTIAMKYQKKGHVIISRDTLRYGIGGGKYIFNKEYEPLILDIAHTMAKKFIKLGVNLIIDEVNVAQEWRDFYINLAKKYGYKVTCILMPRLNQKDSVDRRMKNPHGNFPRELWEKIWTNFYTKYKTPSIEEGIDVIINYEEREEKQ